MVYTGTIYFNNAKTSYYKGKWKADAKHGQGEIVYGSGNTYVGQWADNLKQGAGTMEWKASQPVLSHMGPEVWWCRTAISGMREGGRQGNLMGQVIFCALAD